MDDHARIADALERRRLMVRMAVRFRAAADTLDDQGRLSA